MRGGLEKNKLVSSDYPCQRNKHCRIPCTHVNLDHSNILSCIQDNQDIMPSYADLLSKCNKLLKTLNDMKLPVVKPRWFENSDAGPGVGVSNFEVHFRDAELTLLYERDFACRVHSARGSSGDNKAEKTNSAVGGSIFDGATLQWNKYPKFYNLSDDQIAKLTLQEYDSEEEKRMEMNAWWVAKELACRIDGAPVFSEYIHSFVTEKPGDTLFFNRDYLEQFQKATGGAQKETPGYFYIKKILKFIKEHYRVGELYMEFLKDGCKENNGDQCSWCKDAGWKGPTMARVPEPVPDRENPGHYKDAFDTSNERDTGEARPVDEFAPRANRKKLFTADKISLTVNDKKKIEEFSIQYAVEEEHVTAYVQHMEEQKAYALIREKQQKKRQ